MENTTTIQPDNEGKPKTSWSTINLLSVDIGELMELITDSNTFENEDQTYLSSALENARLSKDCLRKREYSRANHLAEKAFKQVETLYNLRTHLHPDY